MDLSPPIIPPPGTLKNMGCPHQNNEGLPSAEPPLNNFGDGVMVAGPDWPVRVSSGVKTVETSPPILMRTMTDQGTAWDEGSTPPGELEATPLSVTSQDVRRLNEQLIKENEELRSIIDLLKGNTQRRALPSGHEHLLELPQKRCAATAAPPPPPGSIQGSSQKAKTTTSQAKKAWSDAPLGWDGCPKCFTQNRGRPPPPPSVGENRVQKKKKLLGHFATMVGPSFFQTITGDCFRRGVFREPTIVRKNILTC